MFFKFMVFICNRYLFTSIYSSRFSPIFSRLSCQVISQVLPALVGYPL